MAQLAGAEVTALVRREERAANLRETGINKVVIGEDVAAAQSSGPYDFIVDTLGGKSLITVLTFLELDGRCVNVGAATDPEMTLQARLESVPDGVLVPDRNEQGVSKDLRRLAEMVAEGRLHPQVDREASWTEIAEVAQSLLNRHIAGKAVLFVS